MTTSTTRVGMPLDEFLEAGSQQRFELINGERIPKLPTVFDHNEAVFQILMAILTYMGQNNIEGFVRPEATFILPDAYDANWVTGSRTPDLVYYTGGRIEQYKAQTPDYHTRPLSIVPDLVVEVISPNDKLVEVDEKVDLYLSDGVRLIWLVDPQRRKVTIYTPDAENPVVLKGDATLDGGDVLPGFRLPLRELFQF